MFLLVKINFLSKEKSCIKNILVICGTSRIKIIFVLLAKVVTLYMQVFIVEVGDFSLKKIFAGSGSLSLILVLF